TSAVATIAPVITSFISLSSLSRNLLRTRYTNQRISLARELFLYLYPHGGQGLDRRSSRPAGGDPFTQGDRGLPGDCAHLARRPAHRAAPGRGVWAVRAQPGRGRGPWSAAPGGFGPAAVAHAAVQRADALVSRDHEPAGPPRAAWLREAHPPPARPPRGAGRA